MIEQLVSEILERLGMTWTLDSGREITPNEEDVEAFLDLAAKTLYGEPEGTRLTSGGLIVEKTAGTHDVYVYVGTYK